MSVLWKISTRDRLLIKNGAQSICAFYSRRSKSNETADEFFIRELKRKLGVRDREDADEGGPNWELLNPKGNRFYLPNALGVAWQHPKTVGMNSDLDELVDFNSKKPDKFHFSSQQCPALVLEKIKEFFPMALMMITLSYQKDMDAELAARNFVIAAGEICRRLKQDGYWANFWNPFSGKPFFNGSQKLALTDKSVYQFGVKYENLNNCVVMASDDSKNFSGSIFTDAPYDSREMMKTLRVIRLKELLSTFDGLNNKAHF